MSMLSAEEARKNVLESRKELAEVRTRSILNRVMDNSLNGLNSCAVQCEPELQDSVIGKLENLGYRVIKVPDNGFVYSYDFTVYWGGDEE